MLESDSLVYYERLKKSEVGGLCRNQILLQSNPQTWQKAVWEIFLQSNPDSSKRRSFDTCQGESRVELLVMMQKSSRPVRVATAMKPQQFAGVRPLAFFGREGGCEQEFFLHPFVLARFVQRVLKIKFDRRGQPQVLVHASTDQDSGLLNSPQPSGSNSLAQLGGPSRAPSPRAELGAVSGGRERQEENCSAGRPMWGSKRYLFGTRSELSF